MEQSLLHLIAEEHQKVLKLQQDIAQLTEVIQKQEKEIKKLRGTEE